MTDQRIIYANNREQWPEGHWDALSGDAGAPHPDMRCRRMLGTDDGHVVLCGLPVYADAPDNACIFHTSASRDHEEVAAALAAANERGVRLNDINLPSASEISTQADTESTDAAPPAEIIPLAESDAAAFSAEAIPPDELPAVESSISTDRLTLSDENVASHVADAGDGVPPAQVGIDAVDSAAADAMDELAAPEALSDDLMGSLADFIVEAVADTAASAEAATAPEPAHDTTSPASCEAVGDAATPAEPADLPEPDDAPEPADHTASSEDEVLYYENNEEQWPAGLWDELRGEADAPPDHLRCQYDGEVFGPCGLPVYGGLTENRCIFHTPAKRDADELRNALEAAVKRRANLRYADLTSANLWQVDLTDDAQSSEADFTDSAQLSNANLTSADLREADLTRVNLSTADLTDADLREADLTDANLSAATLTGADLRQAVLTDANLSTATLIGAQLSSANLTSADLRQADLTDAKLLKANLTDAKLPNANLTGANLYDANLTGADLRGAKLTGAIDLADADLRGVTLRGFTLSPEARINGVKWTDDEGLIEDERQLRALEINDEDTKKELAGKYRACAEVYRQIKRCYQTSGEYATAGRFFVREIECERMARALTAPHTVPPSEQLRDGWTRARSKTRDIIRGLSVATQPVRSQIADAIGDLRASVTQSAPDFWAAVEERARPIRAAAMNTVNSIRADLKPQIDSAGQWFAQTPVGAESRRLWEAACPLLHSGATVFATLIVLAYRNVAPLFVVAGWMLRAAGLLLWQWVAAGLGRLLDSELVATPDFIRRIHRLLAPYVGWARKGWKWLSHNATRALWFLSYHTCKHGEDPARVVWTMFGTIVTFALSYLIWSPVYTDVALLAGSAEPPPIDFHQALYFSVITFTSLGYGDVKPAHGMCQNLVMLEVFLGVILIALFVGCMIRKISR